MARTTRREIPRGDRILVAVSDLRNPDGSVANITGHTLRFTAKDRVADLDAAAVVSHSEIIAAGADGAAETFVPGSATSGFTATRALHYDVQVADPSGNTKTLEHGIIVVRADIARTAP